MKIETFRKLFIKFFAVIGILIILISPYLLIIDFKKYASVVLTVWVLLIVVYLFKPKKS